MYGYHLWIVLRESTKEADEDSLKEKLHQLETFIRDRKLHTVPARAILGVNCDHIFQCSGSHNHRGDAHDRLMSVLAWIAGQLPGSYGLVYWYDDESPGRNIHDGYNVVVIARGTMTQRYDPFLSPVTPTVED